MAMGTVAASGREFPQDFLKTQRRPGRRPPCVSLRQVPGGEACLPREGPHLGRKLGPVPSRPLVSLSVGSCYANVF